MCRLDLRVDRADPPFVFGLPPGGAFRHSQSFRTVFAADELLYVLTGRWPWRTPRPARCCSPAKGKRSSSGVTRGITRSASTTRRSACSSSSRRRLQPVRRARTRRHAATSSTPLASTGSSAPGRLASGEPGSLRVAPGRRRVAARSRRLVGPREHRAPDGRHAHRCRGTDEPGGDPRRRGARLRHPRCAARRGGRGRGNALPGDAFVVPAGTPHRYAADAAVAEAVFGVAPRYAPPA